MFSDRYSSAGAINNDNLSVLILQQANTVHGLYMFPLTKCILNLFIDMVAQILKKHISTCSPYSVKRKHFINNIVQ